MARAYETYVSLLSDDEQDSDSDLQEPISLSSVELRYHHSRLERQ